VAILVRAKVAAKAVKRGDDMGVSVGIDPEGDEHLERLWHGGQGRLLSAVAGGWNHRSETADRTATGLAVKLLS
jgi:hypothetical protein